MIEIPDEFTDVHKVLLNGAEKHGENSWLQPGIFTFAPRLQSVFRHTMKVSGLWYTSNLRTLGAINIILSELEKAEFNKLNLLDDESGLSHMLHGQCNFAMFHTLISRGLIKENNNDIT